MRYSIAVAHQSSHLLHQDQIAPALADYIEPPRAAELEHEHRLATKYRNWISVTGSVS